jgi:hypothetical protein
MMQDMRAAQAQVAAQAVQYQMGYAAGTAGGGGGGAAGSAAAAGGAGAPPSAYPAPSPASYGWYSASPPGPVLGSPVLVAPPAYQSDVAGTAPAAAPAAAGTTAATTAAAATK